MMPLLEKKSSSMTKYQEKLVKVFSLVLLPLIEEDKEDLGQAMMNTLFDTNGPTRINKLRTEHELIHGKLFHGFLEIDKSLNTILDIVVYINRFPYKNTRITKVNHLRFFIEAYLNEVYILYNRMISYTKSIERTYKAPEIKVQMESLAKVVKKSFQTIVDIRGNHIHVTRYSDRDFDKLIGLEILQNSDIEYIKWYFPYEYKNVRKKWVSLILENQIVILKLIDNYFEKILEIIFDENDEIVLPKVAIHGSR